MPWHPRRSVVVPVDFSESSKDAVRAALDLVAAAENVQLLHVLVPLDVVSPGVAFGEVNDESRKRHVEEHAAQFVESLGISGQHVDVRFGHPADEIVEFAKEQTADLIVIPSHGYHGMKRFLLGSVAEGVIRHAECAVLVLRRTDAE